MDDRFLHEGRREPRPEFATGLRAKLRRQEPGPGVAAASRRTLRPGAALAAAVTVVAVGVLIAFPSVRASAQAFLDLFRVRNFAAVQFDPARLEKLRSLDQNNTLMVFDHQEDIRKPGEPHVYPTIEAAGAAAGMAVRRPTYLPGGLALDTVLVQSEGEARLTVNESKLRALLDALDLRDVQIPPGLNGQAITVHKSPVVIQRFKNGRSEAALVQARSPEVSLPAGVDLARLGEIGLRVLGLDAGESRRIAASIDWHSTLVVPVPLNAGTFRRITVRGNPGLLITTQGERTADDRRRHPGTLLLWTEGDRVFGLMSNLSGPDLIQVGESVQ